MTLVAPQSVAITGAAVTFTAAAAGGDTFVPNVRGVLLIRNADVAPITATIVVPGLTAQGQALPDVPVVVAAGATVAIGPFSSDLDDPTSHLVGVTYTAVANVTVAYLSV